MKKGKINGLMISYIGTIVGLAITIGATFIQYFKYSGFFYSEKYSIWSLILRSIDEPDNMLGTGGDIFVFVLIILGLVFLVISMILILLKKPKTFIFVIITFILMLAGMNGRAWIHYIGLIIALAFSIWYKIASKKK